MVAGALRGALECDPARSSHSCRLLRSPLPWGEVAARSAAGEGVRSIERPYALTPTLSPREREFTAVVATASIASNQVAPSSDFVNHGMPIRIRPFTGS